MTNGQSATLSGVLTTSEPSSGTEVGGQPVTLTLGTGSAMQSCSATTNASGAASCAITDVNQTSGTVTVAASYGGNPNYQSSTATSSATVHTPTTLTVAADTSSYSASTTVSGVLTNSVTGQDIAGESVTLTLNGTQSCSGTTSSGGVVSCAITPNEMSGSYTLSGSFAGDSSKLLLASTGTNNFVVTKAPATVIVTAPSMVVNGSSSTLSAVLTTAEGTGPSGLAVEMTLGSGTLAQSCTGIASSSGAVSCTIATVSQTAGSVPTTVTFAGNGYFLPAGASSTASVVNPAQMACIGSPQNLCIAPQGANENVIGTPGQTVVAGYDFTIPGSSPADRVAVLDAYAAADVSCADESTPRRLQSYSNA